MLNSIVCHLVLFLSIVIYCLFLHLFLYELVDENSQVRTNVECLITLFMTRLFNIRYTKFEIFTFDIPTAIETWSQKY